MEGGVVTAVEVDATVERPSSVSAAKPRPLIGGRACFVWAFQV
jgi:hypothetical protein